jgi:dienelactone hydrolase
MVNKLIISSLLYVALCAGAASNSYAAAMEKLSIAGLEIAAWLPKDGLSNKTIPIIFSHSFGGCAKGYSYFGEALSEEGYAVFAPTHYDSLCSKEKSTRSHGPELPFFSAILWTDQTYIRRKDDITTLINALAKDPRYEDYEWNNIGIAGHSLGGYTALGMAGAWYSWKDERLKAVLALSPYAKPFLVHRNIPKIDVPVMYQGGTTDWLNDDIRNPSGLYDQTKSLKLYVELAHASHLAWIMGGGGRTHRKTITDYSIAFFNHYLRQEPFPKDLMEVSEGVSDVRTDHMLPREERPDIEIPQFHRTGDVILPPGTDEIMMPPNTR